MSTAVQLASFSVLETQRINEVKHIYIVFGKMGGLPEVRWGEYEQSVIHVRTSHVPRFEVELPSDKAVVKESLFTQMGICYDDFRKLEMQEKMKYIRAYARKIHPDGRLWWVEEREDSDEHTTPIQARLYASALFENGIDPKTAQTLLGHAQLSTTMDIYTHVCADVIAAAAAKMEQGFYYVGN